MEIQGGAEKHTRRMEKQGGSKETHEEDGETGKELRNTQGGWRNMKRAEKHMRRIEKKGRGRETHEEDGETGRGRKTH